ncbi:MAG: anthranilate phosphoribosyltransferase [Candidatus Melainabacteria bacterium RIFOXYA12_FULL_32_12]|nr:MAG: anthranilate phosphoribosyltransferase [Candidatus Melainabacteria bacterium RIFOXYA12_FULL_32_12]
MLKTSLKKVVDGKNLTIQEAGDLIDFISEGNALPAQIAAFLTALKMKGETPEEITGFALKMRELVPEINLNGIDMIVDSCGTGGDSANTFNISTASAIVASSSGLHVAKHSNFGFTSKCGSSNVLDALGISLVDTPDSVSDNLKNNNIAFIHAPYFHKCTAQVNDVRKDLGIRTVFNFLGPLTNPTRPTGQVLGVACPKLCPKIAETLKNLGCKKALVVNAQNPAMDEISICGKTLIYKLENGKIESFEIHPEDFGLKIANLKDISGGTPEVNARIIEDIFEGKITDAKLDILLLNSAALLLVGNKTNSLEEGIKSAQDLINSGRTLEKLQELRK